MAVVTTPFARRNQEVARRVEDVLDRCLQRQLAEAENPALQHLVHAVRGFAFSGGKRVRPLFCYWGWRGAGGSAADSEVVAVAAALELFHVAAVIHDDLIDHSNLRRGCPTVHRVLADVHRTEGWRGDSDEFGRSAALLAGDGCLVWSDALLHERDLGVRASEVRALYARLRGEAVHGEYLDLVSEARGGSVSDALTIARLKTAGYTVRYPLQLGALLADGDDRVIAAYDEFGRLIGDAFQLRDDLSGMFGDPAVTGKSADDDVRQGKATVLIATARAMAGSAERKRLDALYGCPSVTVEGLVEVRDIVESVGARTAVEAMIADMRASALQRLDTADIEPQAGAELRGLAALAVAGGG